MNSHEEKLWHSCSLVWLYHRQGQRIWFQASAERRGFLVFWYRNTRYDHFFDHNDDCNTNFFNHYTITYFEYFLFTWHTKMWQPSHKSTLLIITIAVKVVNITTIVTTKCYLIIIVEPILVGMTVTLRRIVPVKDVITRSCLFSGALDAESTLIWTKYSGSGDGAHGSEVDQHAIP